MNTKKKMLAGVHNDENLDTISYSIAVRTAVNPGVINADVIGSKMFTSIR